MQNTKGKEKNFNKVRQKRQLIFKGRTNIPDNATTEAEDRILSFMHGQKLTLSLIIYFRLKKSLKKTRTKYFSDLQNPGEFVLAILTKRI